MSRGERGPRGGRATGHPSISVELPFFGLRTGVVCPLLPPAGGAKGG